MVSDFGHCDVFVCFDQRNNPVFQIVFLLVILLATLSIRRFGILNKSALQCGEVDSQTVAASAFHA